MRRGRIYIFATDGNLKSVVSSSLAELGRDAVWFDETRAWLAVGEAAPDGLLMFCCRPDCSPNLFEEVRSRRAKLPVMFVSDTGSESLATAALRCGASDYFVIPGSTAEFRRSVRQILEPASDPDDEQLIGATPGMVQVHDYIRNVAQSDSNVLITGETGTGKELVASLIHSHSARHAKPLTCINCAAIPDGLFESELFGYERGAFTGATSSYEGKLKASDGGTVFFDEIGDLSSFAQAKLLRLLDGKEIQRLGGVKSYRVNIRIIAATHRDLESFTRDDRFRRDLYFRLNVARVQLPALRERKADIVLIAEHILRLLNRRFGIHVEGFEEEALVCLLRYPWPGNVRELRNILEAMLIQRRSGRITLADLPPAVRDKSQVGGALLSDELARMLAALTATEWNKSKAAEKLHWSRMTLYRKIAKYSLHLDCHKQVGSAGHGRVGQSAERAHGASVERK